MKIGITHRLFLSILTAVSLAVFCVFLIMHWSINRGFMHYLDQSVLERLSERLAQVYAEHGSWDFLRDNPRPRIMRLMAGHPDDGFAPDQSKGPGRGGWEHPPFPPPPGPPRGARMFFIRGRFILLDAARIPVIGNPTYAKEANFRPIVYAGKTVGYIGLVSRTHFLGPLQLEFLKRQRLALVFAAVGMVLVVIIFSIPLAKRIVRPIRAMARATHDLASGRYSVRIPVSSSDEMGRLARDFNEMALTLEKNEKARRQWVADISHELRTPLSVLRGETEALLEGIRDTTPEAISSLHAEVLRLHRLVDDLYQLSLSDLGALAYHKGNLDLGDILRDSVESYRPEFIRKGIMLVLDVARGPEFTVFADNERLYQLFGNLLDNSLKYTDAGGGLIVRLSRNDGRIAIEFEDSAPGVPESELARLFDRLYRVEGSRDRASGGAGLGLSICRNIIEAHAGTISAHPSPSGGVMIRAILPVSGNS
ncbi:MAG: ATP-binding protein [Nitrospiraceae bacterium]|nr:ATP-binding protein [Nitrospiraceae bacterium]